MLDRVEAGPQIARPIVVHHVGGQRHRWRVAVRPIAATKVADRLLAAKHGHLDIDQQDVEAALAGTLQELGPVLGNHQPVAPAPEHVGQELTVEQRVLRQQDVERSFRRCRGTRAQRNRNLTACQRHLEPERAALAGLALAGDGTAHQQDELLADGKTETGAAKTPAGRPVCLHERLEQQGKILGGYADTGVANLDAEVQIPSRPVLELDQDVDPAAHGELERVADKIEQDLLQTDSRRHAPQCRPAGPR